MSVYTEKNNPLKYMFGPPCHNCGSDENWLPGKDGEACRCGWPNKANTEANEPKTVAFGNTTLGATLGCALFVLAAGLGLAAIVAAIIVAMKLTL